MKNSECIELLLEALEYDGKEKVNEKTSLINIKGYDSVGILSIIAMVDKHFGVKIQGQEFMSFKTIGDIINKINMNKSKKKAG